MSALISVIVPVYNTENYLDKCIHSILNQNYRNVEVILIDDGSTDESFKKCELYSQMDKRVCVVHKENGGQSSARNVGLDMCTGDYISFIDSDDWIESDMYSTLLTELERYDACLAVAGRYDAYENSEYVIVGKQLGKNGLFDAYDVLPKMAIGQMSDFSVCDKLYRRDLWNDIRFPEGEIYEDFAVMYKVLIAAKKIVLCDKPLYTYFHRNNSTLTSGFREALIDYTNQTDQFIKDMISWYPEYTNYAIWTHIKAVQLVMKKLLRSEKKIFYDYSELYEKYVKELQKYRCVWKRDPLFSQSDRMVCKILLRKSFARFLFLIKKDKLAKLIEHK